jgi:hypothetical protein
MYTTECKQGNIVRLRDYILSDYQSPGFYFRHLILN